MFKNEESIYVFTYKSTDTLLRYNGSQSWKLNPKRVMKCKYLICVNNSQHALSENEVNHGHAFLICKISNVKRNYGSISDDRWIIEFDEYAEINLPNFWKGWRNPIIYTPTNDIDLNLDEIQFKKVPEVDLKFIEEHEIMEQSYSENLGVINSSKTVEQANSNITNNIFPKKNCLTISEAKSGLSKQYDIPIENIEIILKG